MDLIDTLIKDNWLKDKKIISAFRNIKRADFCPDSVKGFSEENSPLPIGHGQTISQPLTVAFMLELLSLREGDKVLDIGFGSGWTTALISQIIGERGRVFAIESIPEIYNFGNENISKYSFLEKKIAFTILGDGKKGYKEEAPFDKILCSAASEEVPEELKKQLAIGGRMVIPIRSSIILIKKVSETEFKEEVFEGFSFVPLI